LETTPLPHSPESLVPDWAKELPVAITVCDRNAIILYMNNKSAITFDNNGGQDLLGKSLFDCHSPSSIEIIKECCGPVEAISIRLRRMAPGK